VTSARALQRGRPSRLCPRISPQPVGDGPMRGRRRRGFAGPVSGKRRARGLVGIGRRGIAGGRQGTPGVGVGLTRLGRRRGLHGGRCLGLQGGLQAASPRVIGRAGARRRSWGDVSRGMPGLGVDGPGVASRYRRSSTAKRRIVKCLPVGPAKPLRRRPRIGPSQLHAGRCEGKGARGVPLCRARAEASTSSPHKEPQPAMTAPADSHGVPLCRARAEASTSATHRSPSPP